MRALRPKPSPAVLLLVGSRRLRGLPVLVHEASRRVWGRCVFAGHFDQHGETRMSFHQGCDMTIPAAAKQVALPMTGNSAVFNLRRSFPNRDGINDLTSRLSVSPRVS